MLVLGHVVVLLLLVAASLGASSLCRFAKLEIGAEHLLGTMLGASGILLAAIHALGVTNLLSPLALAVAVLALASAVLALTRDGESLPTRTRESALALWESLSRFRALGRSLWRAGPVALLAPGALVAALGWATLLTYVCPSDSWDGVWYHDLMVGYAIQNHGYAPIELPDVRSAPLYQQANGYPRNSEMLSLLFAIYTGRTWLELPSLIAALMLALGTYVFVRRTGPTSRVTALVWAAAIVLLPGVRLVMRSTYVDNAFAAFNVAAFYFASDVRLDRRRVLLAALALGLTLGTKGLGLLSVPPLSLLTLGVLLARGERRDLAKTAGTVLVAATLMLALGGVSYVLGFLRYANPFWPIGMDIAGWKLPGTVTSSAVIVGQKANVWDNLFAVPVPGQDYVDTRVTGYGMVTGVLLVPLAAWGALVVFWRVVLATWRCVSQRRRPHPSEQAGLLFFAIILVGAFTLWKSPALWGARYNLHAVTLLMALSAVPRSEWSRGAAAAVALVANLLMWVWAEPGWGVKWRDALARVGRSAASREAESPLFVKATLLARDRELGPGDLVVWSGNLDFASALHNLSYSNRLQYVGERPVDRAEAQGARWLALPAASADAAIARGRAQRWQPVGMLHNHPQTPTLVLRSLAPRQ